MPRLVQAQFAAAGKADAGQPAPGLLGGRRAAHPMIGQHLHRGVQVVAHQVHLVMRRVRRMHRHLRGRKLEDQPPPADIDMPVAQCVPKERTIGLGVAAVNDDVSTRDHVGDGTPARGGKCRALRTRPLEAGLYTSVEATAWCVAHSAAIYGKPAGADLEKRG